MAEKHIEFQGIINLLIFPILNKRINSDFHLQYLNLLIQTSSKKAVSPGLEEIQHVTLYLMSRLMMFNTWVVKCRTLY